MIVNDSPVKKITVIKGGKHYNCTKAKLSTDECVFVEKNILRINYSNGVITSAKFEATEPIKRDIYVNTISYPSAYNIGDSGMHKNVEVTETVYDYKTINTGMTETQLTQVLKGYQISDRICFVGIAKDTGNASCYYKGYSNLRGISTDWLITQSWLNFQDCLPISVGDYFSWTNINNFPVYWDWDFYMRVPGFSDYSIRLGSNSPALEDTHYMYPKFVKCLIRKAEKITSKSGTMTVELDNINERYGIEVFASKQWNQGADTAINIRKLSPL